MTRRTRGGDTAAMIRAGHERARRNLHDTWALRRSQPLVTFGLSGLARTVGGIGRPVNPIHPPDLRDLPGCPRCVHMTTGARPSVGRTAGRRVERADLPIEARQ